MSSVAYRFPHRNPERNRLEIPRCGPLELAKAYNQTLVEKNLALRFVGRGYIVANTQPGYDEEGDPLPWSWGILSEWRIRNAVWRFLAEGIYDAWAREVQRFQPDRRIVAGVMAALPAALPELPNSELRAIRAAYRAGRQS